jgi:hypothetical protein
MKKPVKGRIAKLRKAITSRYSSWDPLTQAKYLFDLHQQLSNPIS